MTNLNSSNMFEELVHRSYGLSSNANLYRSLKSCGGFVSRMKMLRSLPVHSGCVNTVCWTSDGSRLLSGSDDRMLKVTHALSGKVLSERTTAHQSNIFAAKFLPNCGSSQVVSCAGDGSVQYTDLHDTSSCSQSSAPLATSHVFNCAVGNTTYDVATWSHDRCFATCAEDGHVRCYDLRTVSRCSNTACTRDVIFSAERAVTAMDICPTCEWHFCVSTADGHLRVFDRRFGKPLQPHSGEVRRWLWNGSGAAAVCTATDSRPSAPPTGDNDNNYNRQMRATSLRYEPGGGRRVLASFSGGGLLLYDLTREASSAPAAAANKRADRTAAAAGRDTRRARLRLRGDWSDTGPHAASTTAAASASSASMAAAASRRRAGAGAGGGAAPANSSSATDGGERATGRSAATAATGEWPSISTSTALMIRGIENMLSRLVPSATSNRDANSDPVEEDVEGREDPAPPARDEDGDDLESDWYASRPVTARVMRRFRQRRRIRRQQRQALMESISGPTAWSEPSGGETENHSTAANNHASASSLHLSGSGNDVEGLGDDVEGLRDDVEGLGDDVEEHMAESLDTSAAFPSSNERLFGACSLDSDDSDAASDVDVGAAAATNTTHTASECCQPYLAAHYSGHRNCRTMIKEADFYGDKYVLSGSDCGHVFVWHRHSARVANVLTADAHVVNRVRPHPFDPMLATSGIDYDIKLFAPLAENSSFDASSASQLMEMNGELEEESRYTITVPAMFMIRMLEALNRVSAGESRGSP